MPDITKCTNNRCLKKSDCYRFTSVPSDGNQAFDIFAPDRNTEEDFSCDMMMNTAYIK